MPTVHREHGLRIVIYTDDHPPPHVHVFGDGETKIMLAGADGDAKVVRAVGATMTESRRALSIVRNNRAELLRRWNAIHE